MNNPSTEASNRIYRIVKFERFKEDIIKQVLGLVTYDAWEDQGEGPVLRYLTTKHGREKVLTYLRKISDTAELDLNVIERFRKTVHMQSWTSEPENPLMWQAYGNGGRAVRIATTREKVALLGGINICPIRYQELSLNEELRRIFTPPHIHIDEIFRTKRLRFQGEREIRLVSNIDLTKINSTLPFDITRPTMRLLMKDFVVQGTMTHSEVEGAADSWVANQCLKTISIKHVPDFIEDVLAGPNSNEQFVDEVHAFCEAQKLKFLGKSSIFDFAPL